MGLEGGELSRSLIIIMFIDSGPGTAGSWSPFNWNLGQCLDLWVREILICGLQAAATWEVSSQSIRTFF